MIVKTFSGGAGGGGSCIDYLADGNEKTEGEETNPEFDEEGNRLVTRDGACLLSGDLEITQELINQAAAKFKNGYTAGVLSFEEVDIPMSEKLELMESFEEAILPGIDRTDFDISWIEHTDKDRLELNFVIPRMHLSTGAHLQPYYHDIDQGRIKHWQEAQNARYGYSSPDEPEKKVAITPSFKDSTSRKEIKEAIDGLLASAKPDNRADVIDLLNNIDGIEVVREVKKSISIKVDDHDKNIRLTGGYFEQDFRADKREASRIRTEQERFTSESRERGRYHDAEYRSRLQSASQRNREKYSRIKSNFAKRDARKTQQNEQSAELGSLLNSDTYILHADVNGINVLSDVQSVRDGAKPKNDNGRTPYLAEKRESSLLGERGESKRVGERSESEKKGKTTEEKIKDIFNEQRTNVKNVSRGNAREDKAFAEFASKSARKNRESATVNRGFAERTREYARSLKQNIELIGAKVGGWTEKSMQIMRKKNHEKAKQTHKEKKSKGLGR